MCGHAVLNATLQAIVWLLESWENEDVEIQNTAMAALI
jgi:hypothetical protein